MDVTENVFLITLTLTLTLDPNSNPNSKAQKPFRDKQNDVIFWASVQIPILGNYIQRN